MLRAFSVCLSFLTLFVTTNVIAQECHPQFEVVNDRVVAEIESAQLPDQSTQFRWILGTLMPTEYSRDVYYFSKNGVELPLGTTGAITESPQSIMRYEIEIKPGEADTYYVKLRNYHDGSQLGSGGETDKNNDVKMQFTDSFDNVTAFEKTFSNHGSSTEAVWNWALRFDDNGQDVSYYFTEGINILEIAGRSEGFYADRFHLYKGYNPGYTDGGSDNDINIPETIIEDCIEDPPDSGGGDENGDNSDGGSNDEDDGNEQEVADGISEGDIGPLASVGGGCGFVAGKSNAALWLCLLIMLVLLLIRQRAIGNMSVIRASSEPNMSKCNRKHRF